MSKAEGMSERPCQRRVRQTTAVGPANVGQTKIHPLLHTCEIVGAIVAQCQMPLCVHNTKLDCIRTECHQSRGQKYSKHHVAGVLLCCPRAVLV